jgi:hypothetical protein
MAANVPERSHIFFQSTRTFQAARTPFAMQSGNHNRRTSMTIGTILLIVLILLLVGALPTWSHSRSWGYGPTGGIGLLVVILVVLLLMGRI